MEVRAGENSGYLSMFKTRIQDVALIKGLADGINFVRSFFLTKDLQEGEY